MKKWGDFFEKRWVANLVAVCGGVLLYTLLQNFQIFTGIFGGLLQILAPILIGTIFAYLLNPIALFFAQGIFHTVKSAERRWLLSVGLAILCFLAAITLFFVLLIPSLISSITGIFSNRETYLKNITQIIQDINSWNMGFHLNVSSFTGYLEDLLSESFDYLADNMEQIINVSKNVGSAFFNILIGFILCIYFLTGKKGLLSGINELREAIFKKERIQSHNAFWERCHNILIQYIGYDLLDGFIVGIANAVIMLLLGMPYIALISVIVGVTNLLPTFGPVIGLFIGGLILLLDKPIYSLWFVIMVLIIQVLDGYVLKPRLFGGALGIPPVWTLIAIVIGGKLFGVIGILLAIPFAAVITFLYKESLLPWLKQRNNPKTSGHK